MSDKYHKYHSLLWVMRRLDMISYDQYWEIRYECRDKLEEL